MGKWLLRIAAYFIILLVLKQIFTDIQGDTLSFLLLAAILALANLLIRPLLTLLALPFNIVFFGIASVFVNILTLLIADAIVAGASVGGFWLMALCSVLIMLADGFIRWIRYASRAKRAL